MHIREYKPGEEKALREIFYSSVHDIARKDYSEEQLRAWAPVEYDAEQWRERLRRNKPFVAIIDGEPAGFADVQDSGNTSSKMKGYIDQFYVAGRFAGCGVGTALMEHIHTLAVQRKLTELSSYVSLTAQPFFSRHGFSVTARNYVIKDGLLLRNFIMHKPLLVNLNI